MKVFTLISASAFALNVAGAAIAKDRDKIVETLDLRDFDRIEISGVYDLDVRVGNDFSIELSGTPEEMERVEASVINDVLHLDRSERKGKRRWRMGKNEHGVNAVITMPSLLSLDVSGVVDGSVSGIDAGEFEIDISGVGDMRLDGECGRLDADVSGVGDLEAEGLECRIVEVDVSGVGSASVYASEEVDAEVSGMGDIDVYGSPEKVRKQGSMFADVTIR